MGASGGGAEVTGGPALPGAEVYALARQLDFTSLAGRHTGGMCWPFSQQQWHQLLWYLTRVTIVPPQHARLVPEVSVLECYMSYLYLNGDVRFQSGRTDADHGGWFSAHLDAFTHGLQHFQGLASFDMLIPKVEKGQPRVTWLRSLGLPPSLRLGPGILIPEWGIARQKIFQISRVAPVLEADAPPHAQLWRRLPVGKPGSQNSPVGSQLRLTPLAWGPRFRIRQKSTPPRWYRETLSARPFVAWLRRHSLAAYSLGNSSLLDILQQGGVSSTAQLGHFARAQTFQAIRTKRFLAHAEEATKRGQHLSSTATVGQRPICDACHRPGPLSCAFRWLSMRCDVSSTSGFDARPVTDSLAAQLQQTQEISHLLRRLLD